MPFETKLALLASIVLLLGLVPRALLAFQRRKQRGLDTGDPDGIYLFTSPFCHFCRSMKSLYRKDIEMHQITEIDVSLNTEMAKRYHIASVPTILVVRGGKIVSSFYGVVQPDKLASWLHPL